MLPVFAQLHVFAVVYGTRYHRRYRLVKCVLQDGHQFLCRRHAISSAAKGFCQHGEIRITIVHERRPPVPFQHNSRKNHHRRRPAPHRHSHHFRNGHPLQHGQQSGASWPSVTFDPPRTSVFSCGTFASTTSLSALITAP